ncbi:MAG TPA: N-acetylmuramoyl-L-alanine amidase [Pricia sp.]|nr:N-acetylmuramoyl-L-alanine amidase [Pricia sp.]
MQFDLLFRNRSIGILFLFLGMCLPSRSQDSGLTVVAQTGDGILSLLRKQGVDPYDYYDEFIAMNRENLRDSVHLYAGREYRIPPADLDTVEVVDSIRSKSTEVEDIKTREIPILGAAHSTVLIKSDRLAGTVYYLVSGHGGPDPGALGMSGGKAIPEDEYAYDITLRLARELIAHGARVYVIIRDGNDGIRDDRILEIDHDEEAYLDQPIPLNQVKRLKQRVDIVNDRYRKHKGLYQRLIVTHIDSRSVGQNIDVFFYHHENSKNGKRLSECIHKTFEKNYKKYQPNRVYSGTFEDRTGLYMVRMTHPAMTFIEVGNIRNRKDQRRILIPQNRQALAKWIAEGILLDYEER